MFISPLPERIDVSGTLVEYMTKGEGPPVVFLHPGHGVEPTDAFVAALSAKHRVIVASHPGFGATPLTPGITTVDDLAYFYLDFIERLGLEKIGLVGASFGGWIAAELATRGTRLFSRLVLLDPVGVKFGDRETVDILDVFATTIDQIPELFFHDAALGKRALGNLDFPSLSEASIERFARNRESFLLFGWSPTLYNPKLRQRLHRIKEPTLLLWGENDRIVAPSYGKAYAAAIPGAKFEVIPGAGHYGYIEKPAEFAARTLEFLGAE
jgi:pimeloyl-ACP methyl ester carboxylesterase